MSEQTPSHQDDRFFYTILLSMICIPLIIWLLYSGYQKSLQSPIKSAACQQKCKDSGHDGFEFNWPMLGRPQCTCIDMK